MKVAGSDVEVDGREVAAVCFGPAITVGVLAALLGLPLGSAISAGILAGIVALFVGAYAWGPIATRLYGRTALAPRTRYMAGVAVMLGGVVGGATLATLAASGAGGLLIAADLLPEGVQMTNAGGKAVLAALSLVPMIGGILIGLRLTAAAEAAEGRARE